MAGGALFRVDNCDIDDIDGLPVHRFDAGDLLPSGARAWERLGVGHRCETWLAWSIALWSPVVVKFPRPHQLRHPRSRLSLQRESSALTGSAHPGMPRLVRDGSAANVPFVETEYLDGAALDVEIDHDGAFALGDAAVLGAALLSALRTLHARGIAHLDVKPDNVLLCGGRPVLIDFGSARQIGRTQPTGRPIGSAGYAAPELEAGDPIAAPMDVYGLGAVLHELLTGAPTFSPDVEAADRPAPPPLPDSPLAPLVTSMLESEPGQRPEVGALMARLGEVAASVGHAPWPRWAASSLPETPRTIHSRASTVGP